MNKRSSRGVVNIDPEDDFAKNVVKRLLKAELDRKLLKRVNEVKVEGISERRITNSQLSHVRYVIRKAYSNGDLKNSPKDNPVTRYFDNMKPKGKEQFEKALIGKISLLEWILSYFKEGNKGWDNVWKEIGVGSTKYSLGDVHSDRSELAQEYAIKLIDGVLHRAEKEHGYKEQENGGRL